MNIYQSITRFFEKTDEEANFFQPSCVIFLKMALTEMNLPVSVLLLVINLSALLMQARL